MFRTLFVAILALQSAVFAGDLEQRLAWELESIDFPGYDWLPPVPDTFDVVIIGGGMGGLAAAFGLMKQGITNFHIFDENPTGQEGPWVTYARMRQLRSGKYHTGPCFWMPSLTLRAWYEDKFGAEAWRSLEKVPTSVWMDYLGWYRNVLKLPVTNHTKLLSIQPLESGVLSLNFDQHKTVHARKLVLATGRLGFGGAETPSCMTGVPKCFYAHSIEAIDFKALAGKRVIVIGVGASGFDCAATALENGAATVRMLARRPYVNAVVKLIALLNDGFVQGYHTLPDQERWDMMSYALDNGIAPPREALKRVKGYKNLFLHTDAAIDSVDYKADFLTLHTKQGDFDADFVLLACGFDFEGAKRPELAAFVDQILLWQHRVEPDTCELCPQLGSAPYLGSHFQFLERNIGQAPYLRHIYCFNYGAMMSHGLLGDIHAMSAAAARLTEGIAADFYAENSHHFYEEVLNYEDRIFEEAELPGRD